MRQRCQAYDLTLIFALMTLGFAIPLLFVVWDFFGGALSAFFDPIDGLGNLFFDSFTGFFEGLARSLHGWPGFFYGLIDGSSHPRAGSLRRSFRFFI